MRELFEAVKFTFPYEDVRFPGQASDERILYVTREAKVMLVLRLLGLLVAGGVMLAVAIWLPGVLIVWGGVAVELARMVAVLVAVLFVGLGGWWVYVLWRKSVFILTNRRLTKYIYTTPWNRYNLSLTLDRIDDTGAYAKGYFQAVAGIGTFTARSAAGNRKDKYFYIENVRAYEDLANYVNKLLFHFNRNVEKLDSFRPFIPGLKGERRKRFMKNYPQFWS